MQATQPRSRTRRFVMHALRIVVIVYLVWCAMLYFAQDSMVFPADMAGQAGPVPSQAIVLRRAIDDGNAYAWFLPAPQAGDDQPAPLIVFFHGNAELIDHQLGLARQYHQRGWSVLLPEYRGYGESDGSPSQTAIVDDAVHFIREALARPDVDAERFIIHGRSIGGAIATQVAAQLADPTARHHAPGTLILESAPANVAAMAWGFGVPPLLVRNPFPTDATLRKLNMPVLLFHGRNDTIIPFTDAQRLHDAAPQATLIALECGHNDLPRPADLKTYWGSIDAVLTSLSAGPAGRSSE